MDLTEYVEALRHSLTTAAAAAGDEARETAGLLADTMEPAVRLTVTDALAAMAAEVTEALDGALVDIRLRGRDPEVVVVPPKRPRRTTPATASWPTTDRRLASVPGCPSPQGAGRGAAATASGTLAEHLARPGRPTAAPPRYSPSPPPSGRGPRRYTGFARS